MIDDVSLQKETTFSDFPTLLDVRAIWNDSPSPWFLISVQVNHGAGFVDEVLMVPTYIHLKEVTRLVSEQFKIHSVDYVTPGLVNRTGRWKIEPVLELSELTYGDGSRLPRCLVQGNRVYRANRLEHPEEFAVEDLIYRAL